MSFVIGHKIKGIGNLEGCSATVLRTEYDEVRVRFDFVLDEQRMGVSVNDMMWSRSSLWAFDPAYEATNHFEVQPCRWCGKSNHVGIARCWNCNVNQPHLA